MARRVNVTKTKSESPDFGGAVMGYYFTRLKQAREAKLSHYTFGQGDPSKEMVVEVGGAEFQTDDGKTISFYGTLRACKGTKQDHLHQFLGLYESPSQDLPVMLASAFHYDQCVARLGYGHTFPLAKSNTLRSAGYEAAIVLQSGIYKPFADMDTTLEGVAMTFYSVIPIKSDELALKRRAGLMALMESWDDHGRNILQVDAAPVA